MNGTRIAALLESLEQAAREMQLTKKDLARLGGIHHNTLRNFQGFHARKRHDAPAWSPSVETVARLEEILLNKSASAKPKTRPIVGPRPARPRKG